ncbi:hypothetical protein O0L34_g1779 [Tuta absoluta]|nr:hypothetical protein O0L34_g1779 [Tuta absoluta]
MSSALVRQALEFVDQEEIGGKRNRKRAATTRPTTVGQDYSHTYKKQQKNRKPKLVKKVSSEQTIEENIKKLLELSKPPTDTAIAEKLVQRAVKGKPLLEKIEVKKEEYKSILFPDEEPYSKFEKEYFCS